MLCRATLPASADRRWPWRRLSSPPRRKCVADDECDLADRGCVRGVDENRNCRRGSYRRCHHPRLGRQHKTGWRRTAGNKNKGLAGTKPLAENLISKTSVQTTAWGKRQFALILPSTSTSLITRQSTLQHDHNPDRHPSNSAVDRATPMRYQSIIASVHSATVARRCTATDQIQVLASFMQRREIALATPWRCYPDRVAARHAGAYLDHPRSAEAIDIGTAGPLRRSLGGADSGRRTLSMTRSLGERAVTTVEDH